MNFLGFRRVKTIKNPADNSSIHFRDYITDSKEIVLLVPDFGISMNSSKPIKNFRLRLTRDKISWFTFDLRGQGASKAIFSLDGIASDLKFLISYLWKKHQKQIILVGHSFGGSVVSYACNDMTFPASSIKSIGLLSAASDLSRAGFLGLFIKFTNWLLNDNQILANLGLLENAPFEFSRVRFNLKEARKFLKQATSLNMATGLKNSKSFVFMCQGIDDQVVPYDNLKDFYSAANEPKLAYAIQDCDHLYQNCLKETYNLLKKTLFADSYNSLCDDYRVIRLK